MVQRGINMIEDGGAIVIARLPKCQAALQEDDHRVGIGASPDSCLCQGRPHDRTGEEAVVQTQFSGFFWWASWFDSNSNLKADASDMDGWWRINVCDLREPYEPKRKSLLVEVGE